MAKTPNIDLRDSLVGNNLIINGDMSIAQRGTSFAAIASGAYSVDRWQYLKTGAMVHTVSQDTDVPTFAEAGYLFQNSLRANLTTPDDSIAAGDYCVLQQHIEGYVFRKIAQKPFTVSFWVKSTTTGIRNISLRNTGDDRSIVKEYTINSANTWEKKTLTFPASPSAGTWNYTNLSACKLTWVLSSGSTYQSTPDSWQTGVYLATSNQVNGTATGSTDFRITGVMLNEGSEALPFSLAGGSYGNELALCQRYYYEQVNSVDAGPERTYHERLQVSVLHTHTTSPIPLPKMRAVPTITFYGGIGKTSPGLVYEGGAPTSGWAVYLPGTRGGVVMLWKGVTQPVDTIISFDFTADAEL